MGTALGLCILPVLGNYLHTELGWRGSFLVLGAVLLNCCVCGAVMRPLQLSKRRGQPLMGHELRQPGEDKDQREMGGLRRIGRFLLDSLSKHMAFDQFCNNARYRVYAIGLTWMMLGFVVPLIYLVPYATAHGMEQTQAALLLSILGVVNIMVRPPFGIIFNMPWFKGRHIYVFASALLVNGLSNSICCIGSSFTVLVAYVVVFGLSMSVVGSLMFTVLMDVVEMSRFPSALGLVAVMESVTLLIGPPMAGNLTPNHMVFVVFPGVKGLGGAEVLRAGVASTWPIRPRCGSALNDTLQREAHPSGLMAVAGATGVITQNLITPADINMSDLQSRVLKRQHCCR